MEGASETPTSNNETETPSSMFIQEWFLTEILCRLPAKPLFRCKCVTKQCLALISEPSFVRTYISRASSSSKPRPWTLVTRFTHTQGIRPNEERFDFERNLESSLLASNYESPTISKLVTPMKLVAIATSNGLILCRWALKTYVILNPVTKQHIVLPKSHCLGGGTLAFHAHVDSQVGAVSYKVARLRIVWGGPTTDHIIEEILHWIDESSVDGSGCIISYDPVRIIRTPGSGCIIWCGEIVSAGGEQTIRCIKSDNEGLYVWRMKDYEKGTWDLEHQFGMSEILLPSADNRMVACRSLDNITWHPTKAEIIYFWGRAEGDIDDEEWMLVSFNLRTREVRVNDSIPRVRGFEHLHRMLYLDSPFVPPLWPAILHQPSQPPSSSSGWD